MQTDLFLRHRLGALATLLLIVLVMPHAGYAQTGEDALRLTQRAPGVGLRVSALGGANIAGYADYAALFGNPAGLGYARTSSFSGALGITSVTDDAIYRADGFTSALENDANATNLDHAAYLYKVPTVRGSMVFGAAFSQVTSYERDLLYRGENGSNSITDFFMPLASEFTLVEEGDEVFPEFTRPLSFIAYETFAIDLDLGLLDSGAAVPFLPAVTRGTVQQTGQVTDEGSLKEVSFGGAVEAAPNVMVGASVNIPFGQYRFTRRFTEEDLFDDNDGTGITTDFRDLTFTEGIETDLVGVNVRAGVSASAGDALRVGLALETPTYYTINESFSTRLTTRFDNGDVFSYGDEVGENVGDGGLEYQIITPWRLSAGASYSIAGLTVLGDLEWVDWAELELDSDAISFADENLNIRQAYDAVLNTRLGAEYQLSNVVVRGGLAFQPDPRNAVLDAESDGIDRERTFYSAGFSYLVNEQFAFDVAWTQERFDDRYQPYVDTVTPPPVVDEEVTRNRFTVGFRAMF